MRTYKNFLTVLHTALYDPDVAKTMRIFPVLLERALRIQERELGPKHRAVALTLTNRGNAYGDLGDAGSNSP